MLERQTEQRSLEHRLDCETARMNQQTVPDGFGRWIRLAHIRQPTQEAQIAVLRKPVCHELEKRSLIGRPSRPRLTDAQESFAALAAAKSALALSAPLISFQPSMCARASDKMSGTIAFVRVWESNTTRDQNDIPIPHHRQLASKRGPVKQVGSIGNCRVLASYQSLTSMVAVNCISVPVLACMTSIHNSPGRQAQRRCGLGGSGTARTERSPANLSTFPSSSPGRMCHPLIN